MKPKIKAFLFNFLSFGIIFLILRLTFNFLLPELNNFLVAFMVGFSTIILSPRFAAFRKDDKEIVLMKWFFFKGVKEV